MNKLKLVYDPDNAGKLYMTRKGNQVQQRKYHLTDEEITSLQKRHEQDTSNVPEVTKAKAGKNFFNPYRKGIYWAQLQALYLLGCNEWHEFKEILSMTQKIASSMPSKMNTPNGIIDTNQWEKFRRRIPKEGTSNSKSLIGRIQENFTFMQRLSCHHPSGFKLMQAHASLDMKKVSKDGFLGGILYYRVQIHPTIEESIPTRDLSEYNFGEEEKRYYTYKFVGTVITKDTIEHCNDCCNETEDVCCQEE